MFFLFLDVVDSLFHHGPISETINCYTIDMKEVWGQNRDRESTYLLRQRILGNNMVFVSNIVSLINDHEC